MFSPYWVWPDHDETDVQEELFRTVLARLPDDVELVEAAAARLVGEGVRGEPPDAESLGDPRRH